MIRIEGAGKDYSGRPVLNDLDLKIEGGQCLALLGHNGAGKTTLMKLILGVTRLDRGRINVLGQRPGSAMCRQVIGYLPENIAFHPLLSGHETLVTCLRLKGRDPKGAAPLLNRVGLTDAADRFVGTYSKGMRQRLGLAQALAGNPKILILDEPTTGLDPMLRRTFFEIIADLKADGAAVLLSSHVLTELEAKTDQVAILRQGKLIARGSLDELRRQASLPIRVRLRSSAIGQVAERLGGQRINGESLELNLGHDAKMSFLRQLADMPVEIEDMEWAMPTLDDLYAHYDRQGEAR